MDIKYTRTSSFQPPHDREILEIAENGDFTMWRSIGWATYPPTPIGRFGGQLDAGQRRHVQSLATTASARGELSRRITPDSPVETIDAGATTARLGAYDEPDGPWGELIETLRQWLHDLTAAPRAAIAIEVEPDGRSAHLVHQGTESLQVDMSELTVRAVLWGADHAKAGDWHAPAEARSGQGTVEAGSGWSFDLPFSHGFNVEEGQEVVAYVTFGLLDGQTSVLVAAQTPRRDE